jgi:hypothetical protein
VYYQPDNNDSNQPSFNNQPTQQGPVRAVSEAHAVLMGVRKGHYIAINIDEFRLIGLPGVSFLSYMRKIPIR